MDPEKLQTISTGFIQAKVVLAAAELRLFDVTAGDGVTAADAAREIDGDLRGTEILLDALAAVGVLTKDDARYRLRSELVPVLSEDSPSQFVSMLRHRNRMFREWSRIEDRIRGRAPEPASDRAILNDPQANRDFIRAMVAASRELAPGVVDRIDLGGVRRVADLGGGPGHYASEFASRDAAIEAWLIDLPRTLETARGIAPGWLSHERVRTVAWNFYDDPPPPDLPVFDLVFVSQVLHAESPERNRRLFEKIGKLLGPRGRVVVHEFFVDPDRTTPTEAALFAVNMLAMTPGGWTYTWDEVDAWARDVGLEPAGHERISERSGLAFFRR